MLDRENKGNPTATSISDCHPEKKHIASPSPLNAVGLDTSSRSNAAARPPKILIFLRDCGG